MHLPGWLGCGDPGHHDLLDDVHQRRDLGVIAPGQVLRRAHEDGDVPDPGRLAPGQGIPDVLGSVPVAVAGAGQARLLGPAPVAVDDQPDVPRQRTPGQLPAQPPAVEADGELAERHAAESSLWSREWVYRACC